MSQGAKSKIISTHCAFPDEEKLCVKLATQRGISQYLLDKRALTLSDLEHFVSKRRCQHNPKSGDKSEGYLRTKILHHAKECCDQAVCS